MNNFHGIDECLQDQFQELLSGSQTNFNDFYYIFDHKMIHKNFILANRSYPAHPVAQIQISKNVT